MITAITDTTFQKLPLHDAAFDYVHIDTLKTGEKQVRIRVKLHPSTPPGELTEFGLRKLDFVLFWNDCWHYRANLYGCYSGPESVDDNSIIADSELLRSIASTGLGRGRAFVHYRLLLSGGSTLDLVATEVFIDDLS